MCSHSQCGAAPEPLLLVSLFLLVVSLFVPRYLLLLLIRRRSTAPPPVPPDVALQRSPTCLTVFFCFSPPAVSVLPLAVQLFPDMLDGLLGDMAISSKSSLARVTASRLRGRQASDTDRLAFSMRV